MYHWDQCYQDHQHVCPRQLDHHDFSVKKIAQNLFKTFPEFRDQLLNPESRVSNPDFRDRDPGFGTNKNSRILYYLVARTHKYPLKYAMISTLDIVII